jgi:ATP-dependent Clp protease protease subunit
MSFWNFIEKDEEISLRIDGEIAMEEDFWSWLFGGETTTPNGFRKELEKYKGKNITLYINSTGGDVYAASSIYTSLKEHKGQVTVKIDGYAASAASVIAMAGDKIYMSPTSIMMIHNPWGAFAGEAKDMRHAANVLDEVKNTIINAYAIKTKKPRNKISEMMDQETWMSAKTAMAEGFADEMLYEENEGEVKNEFIFSRLAIQNNASKSLEEFILKFNEFKEKELKNTEVKQEEPQNKIKTEQNQEPENGSFFMDLYQKKIKNLRRKQKHV